jgi:hypothetical protein
MPTDHRLRPENFQRVQHARGQCSRPSLQRSLITGEHQPIRTCRLAILGFRRGQGSEPPKPVLVFDFKNRPAFFWVLHVDPELY